MTNRPSPAPAPGQFRPSFRPRSVLLRITVAATPLAALVLAGGCDVTLHVGRAIGGEGSSTDGGGRPVDGGTSGSGGHFGDSGGTGGAAQGSTDGGVRMPPPAHPPLTSTNELDLLFLVDDSSSMAPLQAKMRAHMADFMNVLKSLPGGMPSLHVAVVSSSLGAGAFDKVPGCWPSSQGDLDGVFQHSAACTQLRADASFLISTVDANGSRINNFEGDIADAFACIANLGDHGCGFEQQFAATQYALEKAQAPNTENSGFLRPNAYLGIVMLTNEDDCSVPAGSILFDPGQLSVHDPLGGLQSYRCNEFGHLCDGQSPQHSTDGLPRTYMSCESNEDGQLVSVGSFVDFLFGLKPGHPEKIFVGAFAGPATPYTVKSAMVTLQNGNTENQPTIQHSCTAGSGGEEYADPGVRIRQWTQAFGPNAFLTSICADDFGPVMSSMAQTLVDPP